MNHLDSKNFIPLKPQWFHIMLALAGGEQHGYGIMQEVLDRTTGKVRLWRRSTDRSSGSSKQD